MNFLCAVSARFPENYEIGVRSNTWGVEERYEKKIGRASEGDLLVFTVGGEFRSIHRIESDPYFDDSYRWPEKDGSRFPYRVRISDPLHKGAVPVDQIVSQISFMRDKKRWQGTVQGAHGVFNPRLTDQDVELIRDRMRPYRRPVRSLEERVRKEAARVPLRLFQEQLEKALEGLLSELDLVPTPRDRGVRREAAPDDAAFTILTRRRNSDVRVVLALDTGRGSSGLLLHVLREMSELRQGPSAPSEVSGLILTDTLRSDLSPAVEEIPNLELRQYRMLLQLEPEPDAAGNGWSAA